jgi:RNA polymerase sigma-70 factor (ECF subfamily)
MIDAEARGAWRELEGKLRPFVARRVPSAADVDDVVQEIFLRLHRSVAALRDDERFGSWVYRVARSAIADHHRRAMRHPLAQGEPGLDDTPAVNDAGDDVALEVAAYAALLVAMLPSPYREALTLTELEGLTQKEAAAMLGISLSGMKSRVQRGRRQVREALDACCRIALDARSRVVSCEPRPGGSAPDGCCCEPDRSSSPAGRTPVEH